MTDKIKISLTLQEKDLIINETFADTHLTEPLERAQIENDLITVYYSPQDLEELIGFIAAEANHADDEVLEADLDSIFDKLSNILDEYEGQ